jgi:hypothetical protein
LHTFPDDLGGVAVCVLDATFVEVTDPEMVEVEVGPEVDPAMKAATGGPGNT